MASENFQSLLEGANAEFQQGKLEAGEQLLSRYLAHVPNNPIALDLAARVALHKGDAAQAEQYAQRAVDLQPIVPFVLTLAEAFKARGALQKANTYFGKVLEKNPTEQRALVGVGEIYEQAGYRQLALEAYSVALGQEPKNAALALKYIGLLPIQKLPEALPILERVKPPADAPAKQRMSFLHQYILFKEWAERAHHGLMPYHAARLDESFFIHARADRDEYERIADSILAANPAHAGAIMAKASCLFSRDRRVECEPYYHKVGKGKAAGVYDNIVFQPDFYRGLETVTDAELGQKLPPLIEVTRAVFDEDHIVYLSCNMSYFVNFARPMLLSLTKVARRPQVHLHIMDGTDEEWASVAAFCKSLDAVVAISAERPNADQRDLMHARCYYHAIRFLRLLHHLRVYGKALWLMDVDALVNRDPRSLFAKMGAADVAFRARPARWEPWNQYNASVIGIRPTAKGETYLRLVAAYISHFHRQDRLGWGIDQLALYSVFKFLEDESRAPGVFLLDDHAVDYEYFDDGYVWCNSGRGKFLQLEQIAKGSAAPADSLQTKYFAALSGYLAQLKT